MSPMIGGHGDLYYFDSGCDSGHLRAVEGLEDDGLAGEK